MPANTADIKRDATAAELARGTKEHATAFCAAYTAHLHTLDKPLRDYRGAELVRSVNKAILRLSASSLTNWRLGYNKYSASLKVLAVNETADEELKAARKFDQAPVALAAAQTTAALLNTECNELRAANVNLKAT